MSELQESFQIEDQAQQQEEQEPVSEPSGLMGGLSTAMQFSPAQLKQTDEEDPSLLGLTGRLITEDWILGNAYNWLIEDNPDVDPDWQLNTEHLDGALRDGVTLDNLEFLADAVSEPDFQRLKEDILEEQQIDADVGKLGAAGMMTRIGVNLLDPVALLLAAKSGGLAYSTKLAKMGKLSKLGAATGIGVGEAAVFEGLSSLDKSTYSDDDFLLNMLGGSVAGGIAARLSMRSKNLPNNINEIPDTPLDEVNRDLDNVVATQGAADIAEQSGQPQVAQQLRESIQPTRVNTADAAGYIQVFGRKIPIRFDMMFHVLNSKSQTIQDRFYNLAQNVAGDVRGGKVVAMSATEAARVIRQSLGKVVNNVRAQDTIFTAELPKGGDRKSRRNLFGQLVEKAVVREDDYIDNLSYEIRIDGEMKVIQATEKQKEALRKARDKYRELTDTIRKEAEKYGVDGFSVLDDEGKIIESGILPNKNYVHRRINPTALNTWQQKLKQAGSENPEEDLIRIIAEAYKRGASKAKGELTDQEALTAARLYVLGIKRASNHQFLSFGTLARANIAELKRVLESKVVDGKLEGDAEQIINDAIGILQKKSTKGDATSRRFEIDETYVHSVKIGDNEVTIDIEDLYDRNAYSGLDTYIRQMSGKIAAAKYMNIKSDKDFEDILKTVQKEADDSPDKKSIEADVKRVRAMYNHLTGRPIDTGLISDGGETTAGRNIQFASRLLQDYNYMRVMNQVGFAQIAEIYNIAAIMGWRAMLKNMPALRVMKRDLDNGEILDDDLLRDIESLTGIGAEYSRYATVSERYTGTADEVLTDTYTATQKKILDISTRGKRATSLISGMTPITTATQRLAAKAAISKMLSVANKKLSEKEYMRFRDLGWTDEQTDAILAQLKNRKGDGLDLDNWDDLELRETFANGLTRWTYRAIQENDIGAMGYFMTQTLGKILTQFRTFMLVSHAKQFVSAAHNARHRKDFQGVHAMMGTTLFGGLSYIAQQQLKDIGTGTDDELSDMFNADYDDESKYSLKNIATAAFNRSSYSGFIPVAVDNVAKYTGFDPVFSHGRSTGLGGDIITGSPSFDTFNKLTNVLMTPGEMLHGDEFDPKLLKSLPYSNAIFIHNAIAAMSDD